MERKILLRTSRKQKTKAKIQNSHPLKVQKKNRMRGRGNIMQEALFKKAPLLIKKKKEQIPLNHLKYAAKNLYKL